MTTVTSKVLSSAGKGALSAVSVAKGVVRVDPNTTDVAVPLVTEKAERFRMQRKHCDDKIEKT